MIFAPHGLDDNTMMVNRHAEAALVALGDRLPVPASVILARLRAMEPEASRSSAIEVCRLQYAFGTSSSSNGDSVVVIIREGVVITAMLRRSWAQSFTPEALRVDTVERWVA